MATTPIHSAGFSSQTDSTAVTPSHRRLTFLDSVRGLAALTVVAQHFLSDRYPGFEAFAREQFNFGQMGVVAFFLVSGFIIPVSLQKYGRVLPFWRGRFFRLYPMYWLSLLLAGVLIYTHHMEAKPFLLQHAAVGMLANASMLQRFIGVPDAEGAYWTLALEMVFYVLCCGLFLTRSLVHPVRNVLVGAAGVVALNNAMAFVLHRSPPAMHLSLVLTSLLGTVAYRVHKGEVRARVFYWLLPVMLAVVAEGFWLHYVLLPDADRAPTRFTGMMSAWLAGYALFLLCFALRGRVFPEWLQWLGRISYSLYLLHDLVANVIPQTLPVALWLPLTTAVSIGLSYLAYRFVEHPAMDLGRA
jgi:peptidoglycan/LPS O-acetylase OafA/YrhL